jgi:hypothetical protein
MSDWISVDDRLPCIKSRENELMVIVNTSTDVFIGWFSKKSGKFLEESMGMALPFKVTHWMPLPKPPHA